MPHLDQAQTPLVSSVFHRKRVFCSYQHAPYLAEALIKVFVDIEFTGKGEGREDWVCMSHPLSSCRIVQSLERSAMNLGESTLLDLKADLLIWEWSCCWQNEMKRPCLFFQVLRFAFHSGPSHLFPYYLLGVEGGKSRSSTLHPVCFWDMQFIHTRKSLRESSRISRSCNHYRPFPVQGIPINSSRSLIIVDPCTLSSGICGALIRTGQA